MMEMGSSSSLMAALGIGGNPSCMHVGSVASGTLIIAIPPLFFISLSLMISKKQKKKSHEQLIRSAVRSSESID